MKTTNAPAAGQGGNVTVLAPQTQDETHRQSALQQLARHLASGGALVARCEALAMVTRGDRLGPIYAAARVLNANAQVARALAHVGLVERRSRTIVETIQTPDPRMAELNSRFPLLDDEAERAELQREIDSIIASEERYRTQLVDGLGI